MNIAVISNGTFSEEYYKEYFDSCNDIKLCCVCSIDEELPKRQYDVIAVDYYNENLSPQKVNNLSEQHPESIIIILADVDFEYEDFDKEAKIMKKFTIDYLSCFNIKDNRYSNEDFYEFAKIMIETKNEDDANYSPPKWYNSELPVNVNLILSIIFIIVLILVSFYYFNY